MLPRHQLLKLSATVTSGFRGQVVLEEASPQTAEFRDKVCPLLSQDLEQRLGL